MSNDKLREAAEDVIAWFSKRAVAGWAESEDGLRINTLRAALADSADDGGVLGARTIERSVEPDTHGEASIDREVRPLSAGAPPESNAALMREAARDLDWMASRAAGHAKRLHISVSLCEAAACIEATLADSADAPEPRNSNTNEGENDGTGRIHKRGSNGDRGSRGRDIQGALESKTDGLLGAPERHPVVSECGEAGSASGVSTTADAPPEVVGKIMKVLEAAKVLIDSAAPLERRDEYAPVSSQRYIVGKKRIEDLRAALAAAQKER